MIDKLYSKYFQKSRSFLYPVLGIQRTKTFTPVNTYMSIEDKFAPEDCKLVCCFQEEDTAEYRAFEEQMLTGNPLYVNKVQLEDFTAYIFDLDSYSSDWDNVLLGHYSRMSVPLKRAIRVYYGEKSAEYQYIDSYLYPEKYMETYAELLNIPLETLQKIGELCDPADIEKETLKISVEHLENLNKTLTL